MAVFISFLFFGLIFFFHGVTLVRSTKSRPSLNVLGQHEVMAKVGENATLPCYFNSGHVSELSALIVHWSKDGTTKYFSNKTCCDFKGHDISEEELANGIATLQLLNVQEKDAGEYTCSIKYEALEGSWRTQFQIQGDNLAGSLKSRPSLNVQGKRLVTAKGGENVTLPCYFNSNHVSELSALIVHWMKDGATKYFSNKTCCDFKGHDISEGELAEGFAPLQLFNVQEKDAGEYTCSIKYEDLEGSWSTKFDIQDCSIVPESMPQYRTLKYGLVSGVVALSGLIAVFVYCCFPG